MKIIFSIFICITLGLSVMGCKSSDKEHSAGSDKLVAEKAPKGGTLVDSLSVAVDGSILPLIQEQAEVFHSAFPNSKINFIAKPELLAVKELISGNASVAILARELNEQESSYFKSRSITPRVFPIWKDGIVIIGNTNSADTSVNIESLVNLLKGVNVGNKKVVFDNLNSSSFRHLQDLGKIEKVASNFIEAVGTSVDVLSMVAENPNKIGVLGFLEFRDLISSFSNKNNIRILSVQNTLGEHADNKFYFPSQSTIAAGQYPLQRTFYILNYQPNLGLGISFSGFVTGDRGQRIVLRSGIVPATMPGREIIIRDEI
ncbi:MAG: PstS family phosphate ABC transporter substrate-binding protein [Sphingobacterium sp.]|uniref:PstS family phosphate ABC transporter substrate-binding protein n=1 Tax=Sphingobacterium sp. JB170 TaxID=1434842 RepID=UPI00097F492B|nr:substrate-binding domain-containing protein [Sphingobacterium sp. JB170]SJN43008.1 Putative phosphate ABC transporter, phosphate-binding component [Sphingobacterium sp. JB170]